MAANKAKTAYVIGAGFSHYAGCPLQADILSYIKEFDITKLDILDTPIDFHEARDTLQDFLSASFSKGTQPPLEDIFTLLDQVIENRGMCHGFTWQRLEEIRRSLNRCILFIFHWTTINAAPSARNFYRSLAAYLLQERIAAGQNADPFVIISLNWDSLLEDDLYWCIKNIGAMRKIDIDYSCYTTPLDKTSPHTPSPSQKPAGIYNLKFAKLHGSANWLICPNCNCLFTGVGEERTSWDLYFRVRACPRCRFQSPDKKDLDSTSLPVLEPLFISPTFLKRFTNPHIQMAWHNAFIDLSEAKQIIIMGYSLPEADYHIRTLFRRAISKEAEVKVILAQGDGPTKYRGKEISTMVEARYKTFFGNNNIDFSFSGVEGYFSRILKQLSLRKRLEFLKRSLK